MAQAPPGIQGPVTPADPYGRNRGKLGQPPMKIPGYKRGIGQYGRKGDPPMKITKTGKAPTPAHQRAVTVKQGNHATALDRQKFLINQGYKLKPDGIWGPESQSAWQAYQKHNITPKLWNAGYRMGPNGKLVRKTGAPASPAANTAPSAPTTPTTPTPATPTSSSPSAAYGTNPPSKAPAPTTPSSSDLTKGLPTLADLAFHPVDPNAYANAETNAQFGNVLGTLRQQRATQAKQNASDLAQIMGWGKQLQGLNTQNLADTNSMLTNDLGDYNAASQGLAAAFGGGANGAAPQIAGALADGAALMSTMGGIDQGFDKRMFTLLGAQTNDALTNQKGVNAQALQNIDAQILDQTKQRGAALAKYLTDAKSMNYDLAGKALSNQAALQNMLMLGKTAPLTIQQEMNNLQNQGDAHTAAVDAHNQAQLDLTTTKAQFNQWLKDNLGGNANFSKLNPTQRASITNRLLQTVPTDPTTGAVPVPGKGSISHIWSGFKNEMQMDGFDVTDPHVQKFLQLAMQRLYPNIIFGPKGNPSGFKK